MTNYDKKPRRTPSEGPGGTPGEETKRPRGFLVVLLVLGLLLVVLLLTNDPYGSGEEMPFSDFMVAVTEGQVEKAVWIREKELIKVTMKSGAEAKGDIRHVFAHPDIPGSESFEKTLADAGVAFSFQAPNQFWSIMLPLIPWILIIVLFWFFFLRQMRGPAGGGGILTFGRARAKLHNREASTTTFDDVAGIQEAKEEVSEIIEFLKNPAKFQRLGGRIPRGVLFVGPPGTGKTLLAKAIAGEAHVPFFSISGSDFVEMFVGVGASRVRDLFKQAKEASPCILFLDEIDAVGRRRGAGLGGGHDEREQTLNAILVEMDGFETDVGVIVCAATNRPDVLDPALLRPGRFDREITIDLPDLNGRQQILEVHARKVKLAPDTDMQVIARGTPMFSGADLEAVINEAALLAVMKDREDIGLVELEEARDKVLWGRQRKSRVMADEDRRVTAYHEAGHAIAAALLDDSEPLHKVTIIPRGRALGATMQLPLQDRYTMARKRILADIQVLYAGRIAEDIFCDDISSGAQNDIERVTELARRMICEWGMSDKIGPINYAESQETLFLGREVTKTRSHSEQMSLEIDREIERVLRDGYQSAEELIKGHLEELERIAQGLLAFEVLSGEEVMRLIAGTSVDALRPGEKQIAPMKPKPTREPTTAPGVAPDPTGPSDDDLEAEGGFAY